MRLEALDERLSVCKVSDYSEVDLDAPFCFTGRTDEERSLVCRTGDVPSNTTERDDGWRGFRVVGVLDFSLIGILSAISGCSRRTASASSRYPRTTPTTCSRKKTASSARCARSKPRDTRSSEVPGALARPCRGGRGWADPYALLPVAMRWKRLKPKYPMTTMATTSPRMLAQMGMLSICGVRT